VLFDELPMPQLVHLPGQVTDPCHGPSYGKSQYCSTTTSALHKGFCCWDSSSALTQALSPAAVHSYSDIVIQKIFIRATQTTLVWLDCTKNKFVRFLFPSFSLTRLVTVLDFTKTWIFYVIADVLWLFIWPLLNIFFQSFSLILNVQGIVIMFISCTK
jgi:hypothetical protein